MTLYDNPEAIILSTRQRKIRDTTTSLVSNFDHLNCSENIVIVSYLLPFLVNITMDLFCRKLYRGCEVQKYGRKGAVRVSSFFQSVSTSGECTLCRNYRRKEFDNIASSHLQLTTPALPTYVGQLGIIFSDVRHPRHSNQPENVANGRHR